MQNFRKKHFFLKSFKPWHYISKKENTLSAKARASVVDVNVGSNPTTLSYSGKKEENQNAISSLVAILEVVELAPGVFKIGP
jgi:hypothetical protein